MKLVNFLGPALFLTLAACAKTQDASHAEEVQSPTRQEANQSGKVPDSKDVPGDSNPGSANATPSATGNRGPKDFQLITTPNQPIVRPDKSLETEPLPLGRNAEWRSQPETPPLYKYEPVKPNILPDSDKSLGAWSGFPENAHNTYESNLRKIYLLAKQEKLPEIKLYGIARYVKADDIKIELIRGFQRAKYEPGLLGGTNDHINDLIQKANLSLWSREDIEEAKERLLKNYTDNKSAIKPNGDALGRLLDRVPFSAEELSLIIANLPITSGRVSFTFRLLERQDLPVESEPVWGSLIKLFRDNHTVPGGTPDINIADYYAHETDEFGNPVVRLSEFGMSRLRKLAASFTERDIAIFSANIMNQVILADMRDAPGKWEHDYLSAIVLESAVNSEEKLLAALAGVVQSTEPLGIYGQSDVDWHYVNQKARRLLFHFNISQAERQNAVSKFLTDTEKTIATIADSLSSAIESGSAEEIKLQSFREATAKVRIAAQYLKYPLDGKPSFYLLEKSRALMAAADHIKNTEKMVQAKMIAGYGINLAIIGLTQSHLAPTEELQFQQTLLDRKTIEDETVSYLTVLAYAEPRSPRSPALDAYFRSLPPADIDNYLNDPRKVEMICGLLDLDGSCIAGAQKATHFLKAKEKAFIDAGYALPFLKNSR